MPVIPISTVKKKKKKLFVAAASRGDLDSFYVNLQLTYGLDQSTLTNVSQLSVGLQTISNSIIDLYAILDPGDTVDTFDVSVYAGTATLPDGFATAAANF